MGRASSAAGATPAGLGARDTLRLEVCFHLYGNDLMETRGPIEAGLGWCCKEDTGFIGSEAIAAVREPARRDARPVRLHRPGHRAPGQPGRTAAARSPPARSRPCLEIGIGMAYVPVDKAEPGTKIEIDVRGRSRAAEVRAQAPVQEGELTWPTASYPDDLKYHAEHDWARIDGDTATLGITWYAQDQLGEVVFFDPPEVGTTIAKDQPYAEVESVKAVSDVDRAAVAARSSRSTRRSRTRPEQINDDPYGEGWLVKVKLSRPVGARLAAGRPTSYQERCLS